MPESSGSTTVVVDAAVCAGHGLCYATAPSTFTPDDEGFGRVIDSGRVPAEQVVRARLGAARCPERAITIQD